MRKITTYLFLPIAVILFLTATLTPANAQTRDFTAVDARVDFSNQLREWDGFGVNYVETSQTFDYEKNHQDYGGLWRLNQTDRDSIYRLFFGDEGLRPDLIKMFLDPLHQTQADGPYDHATTTASMREFVKAGIELTRERNEELEVITTLYGPPAYITKQKILRGRDLDPNHKDDLADYMISWLRYLKFDQQIPVKYISVHNEGESWLRWPEDGGYDETVDAGGHDYNFFWPPQQVNDLIKLMRPKMDAVGLDDVGITNGEPTNWYRFVEWGYAQALADDPEALSKLGLVTSHGFYVGHMNAPRWFGPHTSRGIDLLRESRPELKSWVTSTAWNIARPAPTEEIPWRREFFMNPGFLKEVHGNIYESKINALIPWAAMQNASHWNKPDPNPGTAIRVYDDGTWEIKKGYYYFKQVSRAGRAGMAVAHTSALDSEIAIIAFSSNGTSNPDAFVLINWGDNDRDVEVEILGNKSREFNAYRTTGSQMHDEFRETALPGLLDDTENYQSIGNFEIDDDKLFYSAPAVSATTFFAR